MEGHKSDITCLRVFSPGGSDTSVASASTDATVRVMFNFLGNLANVDVVGQLFKFDLEGKNNHILHSTADSAWPRIAQMAAREGPDRFFGLYYQLFGKALRENRADFLAEFLPQSQIGLLKSNNELEDDDPDNDRGSLLCQAIRLMDSVAVKVIVDCWICFLNTPPSDDNMSIYDQHFGQLSMSDMLMLAEVFPKDFERLVCHVRMIPTKNNGLEDGARFLFEDSADRTMKMDTYSAAEYSTGNSESSIISTISNLYRPPRINIRAGDDDRKELWIESPRSQSMSELTFNAAKAAADVAGAAAGAAGTAAGVAAEVAAEAARQARDITSPRHRHRHGNRPHTPSGRTVRSFNAASRRMSVQSLGDMGEGRVPAKRQQSFFFLPLRGAVHMEMLRVSTFWLFWW